MRPRGARQAQEHGSEDGAPGVRDGEDADTTPVTKSKREHATVKNASYDAKIQQPVSANFRVQNNSGSLGERLRCRSLRQQRQEVFNKSRELGALDTIRLGFLVRDH